MESVLIVIQPSSSVQEFPKSFCASVIVVITRAGRLRVLKWARLVFRIIFGGSTFGLILIGSRPHDTFFVVSNTVYGGFDCRHSLFSLVGPGLRPTVLKCCSVVVVFCFFSRRRKSALLRR